MKKYFKKNSFEGDSPNMLLSEVGDAVTIVQRNLMFNEVHKDGEGKLEREYQVNLAASAYQAIAALESVAASVPKDVRDEALRRVRDKHEKRSDDADRFREMVDRIFGISGDEE